MPYLIGLVSAAGVAVFGRAAGFDREKAFYSTVVLVVASYYVLFAAMSGSLYTVLMESAIMVVFVVAAVIGFKSSVWIIIAALAAHGVFDALRGGVLENSGVPAWWPAFCGTYDLGAAGILACLVRSRKLRWSQQTQESL
jgi:hypothetical protein